MVIEFKNEAAINLLEYTIALAILLIVFIVASTALDTARSNRVQSAVGIETRVNPFGQQASCPPGVDWCY